MRAIIDGKRYDTETADLIASWGNGLSRNDFRYCDEELFRTKRGAWFIVGEGGPMTTYAQACGNGRSAGEALRALTAEEARAWLETHNEVAALEQWFADSIEDA